MNAVVVATHHLLTPTGRSFQLAVCKDGTRVIAAHFNRRELLSLVASLEASVDRARDLGKVQEQMEFMLLRDLFFQALYHAAR